MNHWKIATVILAVLLLGSVTGNMLLYPQAMRRLAAPGEEALISAVQQKGATLLGTTPEMMRAKTFPIVMSMSARTCVELRGKRADDPDYLECRDRQGKVVEARVSGGGF